ncbi:DUF3649 domain-containing protein [Pseudomonas sp. K1(2024)]|uniref:DUF3649 domain-containing protein n=1 Tax=Pseudomonas boreofloridensis TaxID=3064348 RepID=A0ABV4Z539_9PSED|nr:MULTISPECIES: DUF3649 domain-containing protein [unclassified Pseudomonas]MDO7903040.1 DUF3649 domain-containing protein [Pseudomonas sp. K13]MDV9032978.1 DUF3649 domain-containing protein [Pseudomonas sp. RAC1]
MKSQAAGLPLRYRLAVTSRSLAALFGGYLLASAVSVCTSLLMPGAQVDAALTGMMLSFVFYVLAFLWCFACRSALRAWLGVLLPALVLGAVGVLAWWVKQP